MFHEWGKPRIGADGPDKVSLNELVLVAFDRWGNGK
jgi:hypothetical protein